jgi:hypothetical protein
MGKECEENQEYEESRNTRNTWNTEFLGALLTSGTGD